MSKDAKLLIFGC